LNNKICTVPNGYFMYRQNCFSFSFLVSGINLFKNMPKKETLTSSDSDSENEKRVKEKLRKEKALKRKAEKSSDGLSAKKGANASAVKGTIQSDTDTKFFLGKMKYVSVRQFKNMILVDIREYYEKDGELRPGKKGISLQAEQWNLLKENIEEIDNKIQELC